MSNTDKQGVIEFLRSNGIARVEIEFSGGNDEGGVDATTFYNEQGEVMADPMPPHIYLTQIGRTGWGMKDVNGEEFPDGTLVTSVRDDERGYYSRRATAEEVVAHNLHTALYAPIYNKYYSFAGEFYVSGTLTWIVNEERAVMSGEERVDHYEGFEEDY